MHVFVKIFQTTTRTIEKADLTVEIPKTTTAYVKNIIEESI